MSCPQMGGMAGESRMLADAEIKEHERPSGEDHLAHAPGRICEACEQVIEQRQAARRRGESEWVHDVCPRPGGRSG